MLEVKTNAGQRVRASFHSNQGRPVAFCPDGRHILKGSGDKTAILWNAASGRKLRTFEGMMMGVISVAFSPQSKP
uniref:WD40 repeat domain-containing protein n=1 Tax=Posidoniimonas polymericola TaxID=2528002 RepID=UPI0037043B28